MSKRRSSVIANSTYDAVTVDAVKTTEAIYAPNAEYVSYFVQISSASSPTGTTLQIQCSNDGENWADLGSATNVTADGNAHVFLFNIQTAFMYYRLEYTWTSGSYVANTQVIVKGEDL